MSYPIPKSETRSLKELRAHYTLEKRLAKQLMSASREDRRDLYSELYDELYTKVPHLAEHSRETNESYVRDELREVRRFLTKKSVFLELGPGNLGLSIAVAKLVKKVYAVDVSDEYARSLGEALPSNLELIISDGSSVPVPPNSVDVAFSRQLMEHLHPEDAQEQLRNVYKALAPGGRYICITPHRMNGPHDISRYFDDVATGFHLKEYTSKELSELFRSVGFRRVKTLVGLRGHLLPFDCPLGIATTSEVVLRLFPKSFRHWLANTLPVRALIGVRLVGIK